MEEKLRQKYEDWRMLCEEHDRARSRHRAALNAVTAKFGAAAERVGAGPSEPELEEFKQSLHALEEIQRRMDDFINDHP